MRTGKKRGFDEFIKEEVQSLNETINLGYHHARELQNPMQGIKSMVESIREHS